MSAARRLGLERVGDSDRHAARAAPAPLRRGAARPPRPGPRPRRRALRSDRSGGAALGHSALQEPIATAEAIAEAGGEAVRRLVADLAEAGLGVRRLVLDLRPRRRDVQQGLIGTARATRDGAHLRPLLWAKIEKIEPGFGIERLRLVAARVEPLGPQPIHGELAGDRPAPDLALLIDRLAVRLGARRLYRLSALESDLPERSVRRVGPLAPARAGPPGPARSRLLFPPEPVEKVVALLPDGPPRRFRWRGRTYRRRRRRRARADLWRMVAARASEADGPRLFPGRGRGGRPASGSIAGATARIGATGDLSWWMQGVFA